MSITLARRNRASCHIIGERSGEVVSSLSVAYDVLRDPANRMSTTAPPNHQMN